MAGPAGRGRRKRLDPRRGRSWPKCRNATPPAPAPSPVVEPQVSVLTQVGDVRGCPLPLSGSMRRRGAERGMAWGDPSMSGSEEAGGFVLPAGTVAFLLTDVEGSTRAWEAEPDAMAAAMDRHNTIIDAAVSAHGGVCPPAQGEGDSIVAAFARPSDAVLAAQDAQRALTAEPWPTAGPLRVRMAVHAGEARVHRRRQLRRPGHHPHGPTARGRPRRPGAGVGPGAGSDHRPPG